MFGKMHDLILNLKKLDIVLASDSPQRQQILNELGIHHEAVNPNCEEIVGITPEETACENAKRKVLDVISSHPKKVIIAADTVLYAEGKILGKPYSLQKANEYLSIISGKKIKAFSAVAACSSWSKRGSIVLEWAEVTMRELSKRTREWYINTKEPLNCAGSLCISRYGEILVEGIEGEYSCVVGFPKSALLLALSDPVLNKSTLILGDSEKYMLMSKYILMRKIFQIP